MKAAAARFEFSASLKPELWTLRSIRDQFIIAGYADGQVLSFDIRANKCISSLKLSSGVCSIDSRPGLPVVAVTQSGGLYCLGLSSGGELSLSTSRESAHHGTSWAVKYLNDKLAVSSGSSGDLKVWTMSPSRAPLPHLSSSPSNQPTLSIDIVHEHNPSLILCSSMDNSIRILSVQNGI
jgi:WD40 repeat protein